VQSSGTGGAGSTSSTSGTGSTSSTGSQATSASATTGAGGSGCCDCDGDGFEAEACGAHDCDDHDKLVYPGEPLYYAMPSPNPAVGFDWDCSGSEDRNPALDVTVSCPAVSLSGCPSAMGYLATVPPPCGQPGAWGTCAPQGAGCVNNVVDPARVMTCK